MRRADFGTLLCPEFPLRSSPRITVRGQTVQGVRLVLRKAPLPSRMCPWSTRRHCGPLAFRRATEGSRVLRRVWGSQEGAREPYGALAPFCPGRWAPALPGRRRRPLTTPCHGEHPPSREGVNLASSGEPLYRRKISRLLTVKQKGRSSPAAARPPEQRRFTVSSR